MPLGYTVSTHMSSCFPVVISSPEADMPKYTCMQPTIVLYININLALGISLI